MPQVVVVAGTHSGCGKTTVSLALMASFVRSGFVVQAFKAGPDFIDPTHHERITGRASHNLDAWMMGEGGVEDIFNQYAADADVVVIEGVMGLYDGASGYDETGSTAQLAKWLKAPVLLVVDGRSMARSAAALVLGYKSFDKELQLAGVLFNRMGSDNHIRLVEQAMFDLPEVPVLGFLRREKTLITPSRHLGLVMAEEEAGPQADHLADWLESGCNTEQLLFKTAEKKIPAIADIKPSSSVVRLGMARDEAFCFYYKHNLHLLEQAGAELVFFSPLHDKNLPHDLDGLFLGGGYPELYAEALAGNKSMKKDIHKFSATGRPVYAECGGFMYLMQNLTDKKGITWPMAGVFPMQSTMGKNFSALGYREVVTREDFFLGPAWTMLRGHEFHYSTVSFSEEMQSLYKVRERSGWSAVRAGHYKNNTLGSYIHVHFASNPDVPQNFVDACLKIKENNG